MVCIFNNDKVIFNSTYNELMYKCPINLNILGLEIDVKLMYFLYLIYLNLSEASR